jgi:hypothetical protein
MTKFGKQRRRWLGGAVALAGVVLLAGCTLFPLRSQPTPAPPPPTIPSGPLSSPAHAGEFPTLAHAPKDATYLPWDLIEEDTQSDRIYIGSANAGCKTPWRAVVTETSTRITISVVARGGEPCTAQSLTVAGWVHTSAAIAGRSIHHGP